MNHTDRESVEELQRQLAERLVERCISQGNTDSDLEELKGILGHLPEDQCAYERGYLADVFYESDKAVERLFKAALEASQHWSSPPPCDDFYGRWVMPFADDPPPGLWSRLADAFAQKWSSSAAVLLLQGYAEQEGKNHEAAIDCFVKCVDIDASYWRAAWDLGDIYYEVRNWKAAYRCYQHALQHASDEARAAIYFDLGWCYSRMKDHHAAAIAWRTCVELDPDYKHARGNLGWSLIRAGRPEEAVTVLQEARERGTDGKWIIRVLSDALIKLGRCSEAVDRLQSDTYRGHLTKAAKRRIARIEALLEKQRQSGVSSEEVMDAEFDDEDIEIALQEEESPEYTEDGGRLPQPARTLENKPSTGRGATQRPRRRSFRIHSEENLEELVERRIERDQQAFGRRLRVFDLPEHPYGRQFAIPDIGRIDLLAEDLDNGDLIVIELKRDKSPDQVVGQTCRYMGWVRENLAAPGKQVWGITCVGKADRRLQLAASAVPGVDLFEYDLTFTKVLSEE